MRISYFRNPIITLILFIELEWMLGQVKAVPTKITEDPRPKVRDVLFSTLKAQNDDLADDNDW